MVAISITTRLSIAFMGSYGIVRLSDYKSAYAVYEAYECLYSQKSRNHFKNECHDCQVNTSSHETYHVG